MPLTLDQVRTFVWEHLATLRGDPPHIGVEGLDRAVIQQSRAAGLSPLVNGATGFLDGHDSLHVRTAVSELVTAGMLVWGQSAYAQVSGPPHLQVTEFGQRCLRNGPPNVYDPEGYLRRLLASVPLLDPIAREYLEEALTCLHRACYRACAVMLGGASETVMLRTIEVLRDAFQTPQRRSAFERAAIEPLGIAARFRAFRGEIQGLGLPLPLRDNVTIRLDAIFTLIRGARNDAGHPNITSITREAAYEHLLLFPGYCETAYELMAHLQAHPIP